MSKNKCKKLTYSSVSTDIESLFDALYDRCNMYTHVYTLRFMLLRNLLEVLTMTLLSSEIDLRDVLANESIIPISNDSDEGRNSVIIPRKSPEGIRYRHTLLSDMKSLAEFLLYNNCSRNAVRWAVEDISFFFDHPEIFNSVVKAWLLHTDDDIRKSRDILDPDDQEQNFHIAEFADAASDFDYGFKGKYDRLKNLTLNILFKK